MDFTGGIQGMNFSPISNYNSYLKSNTSFDTDAGMEFENILNQQQASMNSPTQVQGSIELNKFDDVLVKNSMEIASNHDSAGNFMQSFSGAINGGLNSVNDAVVKSNKAQEAMAMGEDISVHDVMIASEKASLSLSMAMQLRNKLMSAYNEINNVKV